MQLIFKRLQKKNIENVVVSRYVRNRVQIQLEHFSDHNL